MSEVDNQRIQELEFKLTHIDYAGYELAKMIHVEGRVYRSMSDLYTNYPWIHSNKTQIEVT